MTASVKVAQVPEGSIVLLSGVEVAPEHDLHKMIADSIGHDRFAVVMVTGDTTFEVFGPTDDEALALRVRELVAPPTT